MAIAPRGADPRLSEGLGARLGRMPASLLCVPCHHEDAIVGALELVDKAGGAPFSIDDVELVTLLGGIAGAALSLAGAEVARSRPAGRAGQRAGRASQFRPGRLR